MITNGGENAEAYWSADDQKLIFQAHRPPNTMCDQIFTIDLRTGEEKMRSNGKGRTTCSYFFPNKNKILYASPFGVGDSCPAATQQVAKVRRLLGAVRRRRIHRQFPTAPTSRS
jgi:Tol biopolymer transport system component